MPIFTEIESDDLAHVTGGGGRRPARAGVSNDKSSEMMLMVLTKLTESIGTMKSRKNENLQMMMEMFMAMHGKKAEAKAPEAKK